jgi:hypothetical protein
LVVYTPETKASVARHQLVVRLLLCREILEMMRVWDTDFETMLDVSRDPRCQTPYKYLMILARWGVPLEQAVILPEADTTVTCWGEKFRSMSALQKDPRCLVSYIKLVTAAKSGQPLEVATQGKGIVCWGKTFPSFAAVVKDPRCQVGYNTAMNRLKDGMPIEQATSKLPLGLPTAPDTPPD